MLIGYFDILIILLVVLADFLIWKYSLIKKLDWKVLFVLFILLFVAIPYISTRVEQYRVHQVETDIDGFTLLYIFFRYPTWWVIGIIEILTLRKIVENRNDATTER